jgi:hypothetical protein
MISLRNWKLKTKRKKKPDLNKKNFNPEHRRRKEPESELVELKKHGEIYVGIKKPLNKL